MHVYVYQVKQLLHTDSKLSCFFLIQNGMHVALSTRCIFIAFLKIENVSSMAVCRSMPCSSAISTREPSNPLY